jgi:hypothetical protein
MLALVALPDEIRHLRVLVRLLMLGDLAIAGPPRIFTQSKLTLDEGFEYLHLIIRKPTHECIHYYVGSHQPYKNVCLFLHI